MVEAYLRGPGREETAQARAGMEALRASVPGLYEIVEVKPGRSLTLRDLLRGGRPVTVVDHALHVPEAWVITRMVKVQGRMAITGTRLGMVRTADQDEMMAVLGAALGPAPDAEALRRAMPAISRTWVKQVMD